MEVITITDAAFYQLIDQVITYIQEQNTTPEKQYLTKNQVMVKLGIRSSTTLAKLRKNQDIRVVYVSKRKLLYDADSIDAYLLKKTTAQL